MKHLFFSPLVNISRLLIMPAIVKAMVPVALVFLQLGPYGTKARAAVANEIERFDDGQQAVMLLQVARNRVEVARALMAARLTP